MLEHKYLTKFENFQLKFWSKMFIWSCESKWFNKRIIHGCIRSWFYKQMWKQLKKVPK